MAYSFATFNRVIEMGTPKEPSVDTWMGTANGRWHGESGVVNRDSMICRDSIVRATTTANTACRRALHPRGSRSYSLRSHD